jgi:putative hemolysin
MRTSSLRVPLELTPILPPPLRQWAGQLEPVLHRILVPDEIAAGWEQARQAGAGALFARSLLDSLHIRVALDDQDLLHVPKTGPAVVVANHPHGIAEGLILAVLLDRIRPDWKLLANSLVAGVEALQEHIFAVNPFESAGACAQNRIPLRRSLHWLSGGGLLAMFPAGEVAHLNLRQHTVTDPPWRTTAARLALHAQCPVVPVFFEGANSMSFQVAGVLHPGLRTISLVRELGKLYGKEIRVRIGSPVSNNALENCRNAAHAAAYLQSRTLFLAHRTEAVPHPSSVGPTGKQPRAIAPPEPERRLSEEVAALPAESELGRHGDLSVHIAGAAAIPCLLREIGRCREAAFRAIGEGTGNALDLDRFDHYYQHLFLWDRSGRRLAGAYRLAVTTDVLPRFGVNGLYTSTLFRFKPHFFDLLGPAVELGRSFVMPEYQKDFASLLLLWKGITRIVQRRPEAPVLFGAVSISRDYCAASRGLIAAFLSRRALHPLGGLVVPRRRFRDRLLRDPRIQQFAATATGIEDLSLSIADVERDGKSIPVLIRQYLKVGGRLLGLSVDPTFSHTLDALILADLRSAPLALLERCMGRQEARAFLSVPNRAAVSA